MFFLLSGEGPTDLGICNHGSGSCDAESHAEGPLTLIVDHFVEKNFGFSFVEWNQYRYVGKAELKEKAKEFRRPSPRSLPGIKRPVETGYFFRNAQVLGLLAVELAEELGQPVIAVLFRDADARATGGRGEALAKWKAMIDGFQFAGCVLGVPMMPVPISEAWLICAVKENPYQACESLEERSSSQQASFPLKQELQELLPGQCHREGLCALIHDQKINPDEINMPSFVRFRDRLDQVLGSV